MAEVNDAIIQNLIDAGCDDDFIGAFKELYASGQLPKMLTMLANQRRALLEKIHSDERKIFCIDFLVNRLNKKQ